MGLNMKDQNFITALEKTFDEYEKVGGVSSTRLRKIIDVNNNPVASISKLVKSTRQNYGLMNLKYKNRLDASIEYFVTQFPDKFDSKTVAMAKQKLENL